jgi:hypothetical protein
MRSQAPNLRCTWRDYTPKIVDCIVAGNPEALLGHLCAALGRSELPFRPAVGGGHGHLEKAGVALANGQLWCGRVADLGKLDLLMLVVCAVDRLKQDGQRDLEGLYAELVAHGGRSVVGATGTFWVFVADGAEPLLNVVRMNGEGVGRPFWPLDSMVGQPARTFCRFVSSLPFRSAKKPSVAAISELQSLV